MCKCSRNPGRGWRGMAAPALMMAGHSVKV
ncbi:DUF3649 domain-containing protein [Streptomyces sp. ID05-39B]